MLALYIVPCVYIAYLLLSAIRVHQSSKVPGPWYTNVTSLVLKYHEFNKNRRLWIHALHGKYGSVVRLAPNEVSFSNLEGMKEIYQSGGSGWDKTEFYDLFKQYDQRTMFSTLNKHDHGQRKKLFADRYAMTNIMRPEVLSGIQDRAMSFIQYIEDRKHQLDIYVPLHCYALDCASHFLFNPSGLHSLSNPSDILYMEELSYHDSLKQRVIQHYSPFLDSMLTVFSPKSIPLSKTYVQSCAEASPRISSTTSLISKLQLNSSYLSPIQMAAECMDHMAAGIDTTGDGLCFIMHELSLKRSEHIQTRLRDEIRSNPTTRSDGLSYLDAVIKEGLRLFPPIPMSFPRYVPGPNLRMISGYTLPPGSIASCQPYSLHLLNPEVWGSNATVFDPDRWLDEKKSTEMNRLFFSFGAGARGCIGKNLAMVEMKSLLREVYGRFRSETSSGMKGVDMSIDDQIISSRPKDQKCLIVFENVPTVDR